MTYKGKTQEQVDAEALEALATSARFRRDSMLKESDWMMVADAPTDKVWCAIYRQALRDVTSQEGFPIDINWPSLETKL